MGQHAHGAAKIAGFETVRQASAAFVKRNDASKAGKFLEPTSEMRLLPVDFDIRNKSGEEYEIDIAVSEDLIGNVDLAALGVSRSRPFGRALHGAGLRDQPQLCELAVKVR